MRVLTLTLLCAALLTPTTAYAGSDSPTPYVVTADGVTLPAGTVFPAHGHVNYRTTERSGGVHFDPNNNQPGGAYIGAGFFPIALAPGECLVWIQVSLYDEHFGEGGQAPVCRGVEPTPGPTHTPAPTLPPKPSPTEEPTWEPSEQPTVSPSPVPVSPAPKPSGEPTSAPSPGAPLSVPPVPSTPPAQSGSPALPAPTTSSTPSPLTAAAPRPELPVTGGSFRYLIIAVILTFVGAGMAIYSRKKA